MSKYYDYKGVTITKVRKYGVDWFEFVLNHAPYGVPTVEDCQELIDIITA